MKTKNVILIAMIACLLALIPNVGSVFSQEEARGPWMDFMHIKNYGNPDAQFAALEAGEIDFTDWQLSKPWIDKFAKIPEDVTLRSYFEIGSWEFDIFHQRWPTGCDGLTPHTRQRPETGAGDGNPPGPGYDWDPETSTWKVYFDPECPHCVSAWGFRLALAYLVDRPYIITEILKGYGYAADTFMPVPALAGWLNMENLTTSSFTYHGPNGDVLIPSLFFSRNVDKAKEVLDAAGFTLITTGPDAGKRQDPRKAANQALSPIIFYIRLDDPAREAAGLRLASDIAALGVPVDKRDVEKTVCYKAVMIEYNYNIYTGGYSLGADPFWLRDIMASSGYWAPIGWANGYQGFCNLEFDAAADKTYFGSSYAEVTEGAHEATYLINKYVGVLDLWAYAGIQGYRTGWNGVINHEAYGPTAPITGGGNIWSFLNGRWNGPPRTGAQANTIWWGFKSNLEGPNIISAQWVWDAQVTERIYDKLIWRNPYNLAEDIGFMAESWTDLVEWEPGKGYITFTLRPGMKWHDGSPVEPADVKFSLEFTRDCGIGVAWDYPQVANVYKVDTQTEDPTLGPMEIRVYTTSMSFWALHWIGYIAMINRKMWLAANDYYGWGYTWPHAPGQDWDWNRLGVREYHPWEEDIYNAATGGVGSDGIVDLAQDGCGPWIWVDGNLMEYVDLKADRDYFLTRTAVKNMLNGLFQRAGDVNRDGTVNIGDISAIARALGTDETWPVGTGWGQFNPDADLNGDSKVDAIDLGTVGKAYGKVAG